MKTLFVALAIVAFVQVVRAEDEDDAESKTLLYGHPKNYGYNFYGLRKCPAIDRCRRGGRDNSCRSNKWCQYRPTEAVLDFGQFSQYLQNPYYSTYVDMLYNHVSKLYSREVVRIAPLVGRICLNPCNQLYTYKSVQAVVKMSYYDYYMMQHQQNAGQIRSGSDDGEQGDAKPDANPQDASSNTLIPQFPQYLPFPQMPSYQQNNIGDSIFNFFWNSLPSYAHHGYGGKKVGRPQLPQSYPQLTNVLVKVPNGCKCYNYNQPFPHYPKHG